jgi:hypothetical protein
MQKENKSFYFNVIKINPIAKQVLDIPITPYVLSFDYSVPGEGYYRNASCALNLISTITHLRKLLKLTFSLKKCMYQFKKT